VVHLLVGAFLAAVASQPQQNLSPLSVVRPVVAVSRLPSQPHLQVPQRLAVAFLAAAASLLLYLFPLPVVHRVAVVFPRLSHLLQVLQLLAVGLGAVVFLHQVAVLVAHLPVAVFLLLLLMEVHPSVAVYLLVSPFEVSVR
jgi:hypothetical protein